MNEWKISVIGESDGQVFHNKNNNKREENKKKYKMGDKWKDTIKKGREALGWEGDREKKQKKDKGQRKEREKGKVA